MTSMICGGSQKPIHTFPELVHPNLSKLIPSSMYGNWSTQFATISIGNRGPRRRGSADEVGLGLHAIDISGKDVLCDGFRLRLREGDELLKIWCVPHEQKNMFNRHTSAGKTSHDDSVSVAVS